MLEDLVRRYHIAYLRILAHATLAASQLFDRFAGPTDTELDVWVRHVTPLAAGARQATVDLVTAYLDQYDAAAGGEGVTIDRTAVLAQIRNGLPIDDIYTRPIITLRSALADGHDYLDAFAGARARAANTISSDVVLAQRDAAADGLSNTPHIVGYRRVLTAASCPFCATASTQTYHSSDLMPIHPHCDCGIAPIIGLRDPGRVINRQLLTDLKHEGGSKYWKGDFTVDEHGAIHHTAVDGQPGAPLEVAVHEHGELGPVLADARQHFAGPDALNV